MGGEVPRGRLHRDAARHPADARRRHGWGNREGVRHDDGRGGELDQGDAGQAGRAGHDGDGSTTTARTAKSRRHHDGCGIGGAAAGESPPAASPRRQAPPRMWKGSVEGHTTLGWRAIAVSAPGHRGGSVAATAGRALTTASGAGSGAAMPTGAAWDGSGGSVGAVRQPPRRTARCRRRLRDGRSAGANSAITPPPTGNGHGNAGQRQRQRQRQWRGKAASQRIPARRPSRLA